MGFVETAADPWGREVLTHVAWNVLWVSIFVFITFLVAHASYVILSAHRVRAKAETDALEAKHAGLPKRVKRHSFMARLFHWVMAGSIFTLLGTAFFPIMGWRFDWVGVHYTAGLVLTGAIVFHIFHTVFFLDFWSIWVGPKDIPEFKAEVMREAGHEVPGPHPAKYPIGNRLYHLVLTFVGCTVALTGMVMLWRMGTPFITPNPYILPEGAWGWIYVFHGMTGLSLAGLSLAHIIFGARPRNWWLTKSMIVGSVSRREYLEHHEPSRWPIGPRGRGWSKSVPPQAVAPETAATATAAPATATTAAAAPETGDA